MLANGFTHHDVALHSGFAHEHEEFPNCFTDFAYCVHVIISLCTSILTCCSAQTQWVFYTTQTCMISMATYQLCFQQLGYFLAINLFDLHRISQDTFVFHNLFTQGMDFTLNLFHGILCPAISGQAHNTLNLIVC